MSEWRWREADFGCPWLACTKTDGNNVTSTAVQQYTRYQKVSTVIMVQLMLNLNDRLNYSTLW